MSATANGVDRSADPAVAVLERRARRLAERPHEDDLTGKDMLICLTGRERYALPLDQLRGVQGTSAIARVPCTPRHVVGLLNVRGETVAVLEFGAALGLAPAATAPANPRVVLTERDGETVGLLVDVVVGVEQIDMTRLVRPLSEASYVRGVTAEATIVLDLRELLSGNRLVVDETPS